MRTILQNSLSVLVAITLALSLTGTAQAANPRYTQRASVDSLGNEGNGDSINPTISANGRYIVFASNASNLVAGDTNGQTDIFLRDTQAGITTRLSVASDGTQANGASGDPCISADGRYVAFYSTASNLVTGDNNSASDIFVRDTILNTTTRASVAWNGAEANNASYDPAISPNGYVVAFDSLASNLVSNDTNNAWDVFARDLYNGTTSRVSVARSGLVTTQANDSSFNPSVSLDGSYIAYESYATNLVSGDTNGARDIFITYVQMGLTDRVSVSTLGAEANDSSTAPSISADGRYVAFASSAGNLVNGDTNSRDDIFVRDAQAGTTVRVSVASNGIQVDDSSSDPAISNDGSSVAFSSTSSNLTGGDTNGLNDIFVRDLQAGTTTRVSVHSNGTEGNGSSSTPAISADGRYVAFSSGASNFGGRDLNGSLDVFVNGSPTFADVPPTYWAWGFIEQLYTQGITGGCSSNPLNYCPDAVVTRAQMAVFIEKELYGPAFVPPNVAPSYTDTVGHWAEDWIEAFKNDGITAGCGPGLFCPDLAVSRAQMAVFLLRAKYGSAYTPPSVGGSTGFADVSTTYWAAAWIKQLAAEGITTGCGNGNFCPEISVTRAQMAVFLIKTFQ